MVKIHPSPLHSGRWGAGGSHRHAAAQRRRWTRWGGSFGVALPQGQGIMIGEEETKVKDGETMLVGGKWWWINGEFMVDWWLADSWLMVDWWLITCELIVNWTDDG